MEFSQQSLLKLGKLGANDVAFITKHRGQHNRLGFAYQLVFVRLFGKFPQISPLEIIDELLDYTAVQLSINIEYVNQYHHNRKTISKHQSEISNYLHLNSYNLSNEKMVREFIFKECMHLEARSLLKIKAIRFLKEHKILLPAMSRLERLIATQRILARDHIFESINSKLSTDVKWNLENLLIKFGDLSHLELIRKPPKCASVKSVNNLADRMNLIKDTGILDIDINVNNNYQKIFAREIRVYSITRIRALPVMHRHTALACFLQQSYKDTIDFLIDTYIKLLNKSQSRSKHLAEAELNEQEDNIKKSLDNYKDMKAIIVDDNIADADLRNVIYKKFADEFNNDMNGMEFISKSKAVRIFCFMQKKYSYFRQFSKLVFDHLELELSSSGKTDIIEAIGVLKELNANNQRKLTSDVPIKFIPKKIKDEVFTEGSINRVAWETALLIGVRDEIHNNNIFANHSKRFCQFSNFFMPLSQWNEFRKEFFSKTELPKDNVTEYLTKRLNKSYDSYLSVKDNDYAKVVDKQWLLSTDPATQLSDVENKSLKALKNWLASHMVKIKLPHLLVEVDNELKFTDCFMLADKGDKQDNICKVIISIMAHGCNIGMYSMSQLVNEVSYEDMKKITDWQLTDDAQRKALSWIVNAISRLSVSKNWGEGKSSSSDSHLIAYHQKVLQQNYSPRFGDFALAFYTFVADNYAPFYSRPIECNEGEAPYALDGTLYHESDLVLEEHYVDTRASAAIMFTAFGFVGEKFNPRIKGIQKHRIYKIDRDKDYGVLEPLLKHKSSIIDMKIIENQWQDMAHFYGSISSGYITASVALKRLLALNPSNEFYKANLLLGRILKTENTLLNMIDPEKRKRRHRVLLKGEEMHQLARDVSYGKGGEITARDLISQRNSCNCLTLVMACIVYWQSKEIARILMEHEVEAKNYDLSLLAHISPVGWENVILYGEYIIDKKRVRQ